MIAGVKKIIIALILVVALISGCSNVGRNNENNTAHSEVCDFESLDDKVGIFSNADEELLVIDVDTINEKKVDDIKVGDRVLISVDGMKKNADGTYTPSVIKIEYLESDPSKIIVE